MLHVGLLLAVSISLAFLIGVLLWLGLGRPHLVTGGPLDAKARFEGIKLILAVVGGIGAVVALTIAYRRQRHSESAEYREDLRLFTDRFGEAARQLGEEHAATRMAGVYAMARTADDAHDFDSRQLCIDVLCGYLRLPYEPDPNLAGHRPGEETVRGAITRVIRDHLRPGFSTVSWCGHNFRFLGAVFDGLDFTGIHLTGGHMNFQGARFLAATFYFSATIDGGTVWFNKARFESGSVRFNGARLLAGRVSFKDAVFLGGVVSFRDVEYNPAAMTLDFSGARIEGASIDWADLPIPSQALEETNVLQRTADAPTSDAPLGAASCALT